MFFKRFKKHFVFKIPKNTLVVYFKNKNILLFKTNFKKCFLVINKKFNFLIVKDKMIVFNNINQELAISKKKRFVNLKNLFSRFLSKFNYDSKINFYNKLNLNGIGYRVFETKYNNILVFKLGFSHFIYFKLKFKYLILKDIKLFIISELYKKGKKILSIIQKLKYPEPYKSKGILVNNQKIKLKRSKKI